ncbi:MAG TPA: gluconeogenesis factor YvcK family protein [Ktedonobacterales bacterium]
MQQAIERQAHALLGVRGKHIVTIGGGAGPFALLSALKKHDCSITAIVTMADSGGSSRRLMDEYGTLPVGDLRQALVALSRKGVLWREVFTYRFKENGKAAGRGADRGEHSTSTATLGGHSLGNLIITALQEINHGNLLHAIEDAQQLLDTAGAVLPVTLQPATLCAELDDGSVIVSETNIDTRGARMPETDGTLSPIKRLYLQKSVEACEDALRAIRRADVIVIGPGSLYTSILANFVVDGVAEAVRASEAQKVYVCNLMTNRGETDGYRASDFVREIHRYLGDRVDRVVAHDGGFPARLLERYASDGQHPVVPDLDELRELAPEVVVDSLLAVYQGALLRHDAERLLRAIFTPAEYLT